MSSQSVQRQAKTLLRDAGVTEAPINVFAIAEHLGIQCRAAELGDDVSGILVVKGSESVIGYNKGHTKTRQRFTVAHEIAHFQLHRKSDKLFIDKGALIMHRDGTSAQGKDVHEIEANAFAAALLMPEALIKAEIDRQGLRLNDERDVEILAQVFDVSVQAMTFRLINLRIIHTTMI